MKIKETLTVTIKKTDIDFLKNYVHSMDSAIQSLCGAVLSAEVDSKITHPDDVKNKKISIGNVSLGSTETKNHVLDILSGLK